jgi:dihydroorotase-like cyclic amidohydrolase
MATPKLPGLIDIHVHLRDPGETHKEDFATGTAAALAGGVVAVLDMPNNKPPVVDEETLRNKAELASQKARCDFGFYLGATSGNAKHAVPSRDAAGLKLYVDQTYGPLRVRDLPTVMAHFRHWPRDQPIAVHAEGLATAMVIGLAHAYDRPAHVCHVSRRAEIELIKQAKERGVKITCEVTPHHLFLTEEDATELGSFGQMKPPLGKQEDGEALWNNLAIIDAVATDHAPHTIEEKEGQASPPGVPGLETMLPLLLNGVAGGRLSLERLVELTHYGPVRIMGVRSPEETYVEVDPHATYTLQGAGLFTKCGWTPFQGMTVQGRVRRVYLRGVKVFEDGKVLAPEGFGQPLHLR